MTRCHFPVNYDEVHNKTGVSKKQKCNDQHFVILWGFFQNPITLPTGVSKSCNLSECCLHSFKHSLQKQICLWGQYIWPSNGSRPMTRSGKMSRKLAAL